MNKEANNSKNIKTQDKSINSFVGDKSLDNNSKIIRLNLRYRRNNENFQ